MQIERVELSVILDLRWRVLRAGMPRESAIFTHDDAPTSVHFAARNGIGEVIGCVTLHRQPFPDGMGNDHRNRAALQGVSLKDFSEAWQLRGMAVEPASRGTGLGAALLREVEGHVLIAAGRGESPPLLWCNARKPAVPFYERHGWLVVSEEFDVPTAGPHWRMARVLPA